MNIYKLFFCDETEDYRWPRFVNAGETTHFRLRTPSDISAAPVWVNEEVEIEMTLERETERFKYFVCETAVSDKKVGYCFKIFYDNRFYYYTRSGLQDFYNYHDRFVLTPGFSIPDWAIGSVMYQIFTDRFCCGNTKSTVVNNEYFYAGSYVQRVYDWNAPVADMDVGRFYGGDLCGVRSKLDYLQELGVETLYLNPIFVSPSNHKYDCQDYDHVDPHLTVITKDVGDPGAYGNNRYVIRTTYKENLEASNAWFADFCKEVHSRGMKIILDGVFNHCGSFNKWLDREGFYSANEGEEAGAYNSPKSKYRGFFRFTNPDDRNSYEGWWGFDTLPKLNYEGSEELCEYICDIGRKWVSEPYCVDGWRLDVAADLGHSSEFNHAFWKRFRKAVKEANPNAIILAEHYGDASSWLQGDEWDSIMNYDAFMEPITWFLTGMEKHSDEYKEYFRNNADAFMERMFSEMKKFDHYSLYMAMNELSNHDHSRFMTRTNHYVGRVQHLGAEAASRDIDRRVFMEAVVWQMTWPGNPTIYYGDEAGVCGFTDPDSRRTYPWGNEDKELIQLHKELTALRKGLPVLRFGSLIPVYQEYGIIGFLRQDKDSAVLVIINNNDYEKEVDINLEGMDRIPEVFVSLIATGSEGINRGARFYPTYDESIHLHLKEKSSIVLKLLQ